MNNENINQMGNNNLKTVDLDLRTPLQKEKDLRNEKIVDDYRTIQLNLPKNATKWAIYRKLGETYGM
jgi:hypothetical protein